MGFGEHAAKTYQEVWTHHPSYVKWALKVSQEEEVSPRLGRFIRWLNMDLKMEPAEEEAKVQEEITTDMLKKMGYLDRRSKGAEPSEISFKSGSATSSQVAQANQLRTTLVSTVKDLQEEVRDLKEEKSMSQPRKKGTSETTTDSFQMM